LTTRKLKKWIGDVPLHVLVLALALEFVSNLLSLRPGSSYHLESFTNIPHVFHVDSHPIGDNLSHFKRSRQRMASGFDHVNKRVSRLSGLISVSVIFWGLPIRFPLMKYAQFCAYHLQALNLFWIFHFSKMPPHRLEQK
jgi:hypothetical protein